MVNEEENRKQKRKGMFIFILLLVLLCSGFISYVVLADTVIFDFRGNKATWNIVISDIEMKERHGNVIQNNVEHGNISANFDVTFSNPGDYIIYTVYLENKGVINARLSSITGIDTANNTLPYPIKYIVISNDNKVLEAKSIVSFDIKIIWAYSDESYELNNVYSKFATINFNYEQE